MLRKNYFIILTAAALFFISSTAIFAQTAPVRGTIELKKADGTTAPVASAVIDVYRTDAKGKLPSGKSDKKGNFSFAGIPLGQVVMLVVSAPGIQPQVFPQVRAGQDNIKLTVYEGDGKRYTEEEARAVIDAPKNAENSAANTNSNPKPSAEDEAAAKKEKEEYDKKVAEVTAKNEKIKNANQVIDKALSEGNAAFDAKNYDLALVKYNEGINASPDFVGTAPVLLNNKGIVLRMRAIDAYNSGVKSTDAAQKAEKLAAARKDFQASLAAFIESYKISKNAPAADIKDQNNYNLNIYNALSGIVEDYRLMGQTGTVDSSKAADVKATFQDYLAVETDSVKKAKAQIVLADVLRATGDFDNAVPEYRKVVEATPDNPDALAGLGLSLFSVGVTNNDKAMMQEGLNYMEKFAQVAPATHPLKSSVADAVTYLKTEQKLTPQKVSSGKKKN